MELTARTNPALTGRITDLFFKFVCLLFPAAMVYILLTDGDGCGDKPMDFRFFPITSIIAFVLALVWSVIDRQRYRYTRLETALHILVRCFLSYIIMQYGAAKVVDMQFSSSIYGLDSKLIDLGPMGLAWAFFGFSYEYEFFIGCGQIIAAMLLLYRRTATLGAVLLVTIMSNIVFVNFSFNVCVKFFSSTYLVMGIYLLLDDARRLANFFIFNRAVAPRVFNPLFTKPVANKIFRIVGVIAFIGIIIYPLWETFHMKDKYGIGKHTTLYGVWTVDSVHASSEPLNTNLQADSSGWKKIIFEDYDYAYIKSWKNTRGTFRYKVDTMKHVLNLNQVYPDTLTVIKGNYVRTKDTLVFTGFYNKDSVYAKMRLQRKYFIRN